MFGFGYILKNSRLTDFPVKNNECEYESVHFDHAMYV